MKDSKEILAYIDIGIQRLLSHPFQYAECSRFLELLLIQFEQVRAFILDYTKGSENAYVSYLQSKGCDAATFTARDIAASQRTEEQRMDSFVEFFRQYLRTQSRM